MSASELSEAAKPPPTKRNIFSNQTDKLGRVASGVAVCVFYLSWDNMFYLQFGKANLPPIDVFYIENKRASQKTKLLLLSNLNVFGSALLTNSHTQIDISKELIIRKEISYTFSLRVTLRVHSWSQFLQT